MGGMRQTRSQKGAGAGMSAANVVVERLKKIRALNSCPAILGIDSIVLRKVSKHFYTFTK